MRLEAAALLLLPFVAFLGLSCLAVVVAFTGLVVGLAAVVGVVLAAIVFFVGVALASECLGIVIVLLNSVFLQNYLAGWVVLMPGLVLLGAKIDGLTAAPNAFSGSSLRL